MKKRISLFIIISLFFNALSYQGHQVEAVSVVKAETKLPSRDLNVPSESKPKPDTKHQVALAMNLPVSNMKDVKEVKGEQLSVKKYSVEEVEMLARLINGEARGESFEGKVAVAAVTLNRVRSSKFPNTIKSVIFQSGAYTAVSDGQYRKKPGKKAYLAAYTALKGEDPSSGALFYYNPKTATDNWIRSRHIIKTIGKHVFTR